MLLSGCYLGNSIFTTFVLIKQQVENVKKDNDECTDKNKNKNEIKYKIMTISHWHIGQKRKKNLEKIIKM